MKWIALDQGSAAWLRWRQSGLGGSDAPSMCGISPWSDPMTLWKQKIGEAPWEADNFAMRRGRRLEPMVRRMYERRYNTPVAPMCAEHEELTWMLGSIDGITLCGGLIIEIKCPDWKAHTLALNHDRVPGYYWPQVQHLLMVSGADVCHYVSFSENKKFAPEERLAVVEVLPDPRSFDSLTIIERYFWQCVQDRTPPAALITPLAA